VIDRPIGSTVCFGRLSAPTPQSPINPTLPSRARHQQIVPWRDHFAFGNVGGQASMIERFDPTDYSIAVRRNRKPPNSWRWEIYGPGKSIPVERSPNRFQTMAEATRSGKEALQRFVKLRATLSI